MAEMKFKYGYIRFGFFSVMVNHIVYVTAPCKLEEVGFINLEKILGANTNWEYGFAIHTTAAGTLLQTYVTLGEAISAHAEILKQIEQMTLMTFKEDLPHGGNE